MAAVLFRKSAPQKEKDREGQPIIFDSYDMSPVLLGTGKSEGYAGPITITQYQRFQHVRPRSPWLPPTCVRWAGVALTKVVTPRASAIEASTSQYSPDHPHPSAWAVGRSPICALVA